MDKRQKQIAMIGGGLLALLLLYRWYVGRQNTAQTGTATPATDTAASDYASLAGQEQGDVAALQNQFMQLSGQEKSDVAGINSAIQAGSAAEQGDISGLTGQIGALTAQLNSFTPPDLGPLTSEVAALATGQTKIDRSLNATITTHKGGKFYDYYKKVTGHAPPAKVKVSDFIYQAWKDGVKASALAKPHPSAPKQKHVAHPNPGHKPTGGASGYKQPGGPMAHGPSSSGGAGLAAAPPKHGTPKRPAPKRKRR